jgi:hypothetical protein
MYCVLFWSTKLDVELGGDRITAAAPICPFISLASVKMQVVCDSSQRLFCCDIASSSVLAMTTGGGFHQGVAV